MKVLAVSNIWPRPDSPFAGIFVRREVLALRALGLDVEEHATAYRRTPHKDWAAFRDHVAASRPDVVNVYFGSVGAFASALGCPVPLVLTFGGSDLLGPARRDPPVEKVVGALAAVFSQLAAPNADAIVARSEQLRQGLLLARDRQRAYVIPAGVDTAAFRPLDKAACRRQLGWDPAETVVLFGASRHRTIKRFDRAQAAVRRLAELGLPARLATIEQVPPELMPVHMNAADCLLLTSQHEGSPNVVKEAVACGVPVVSVPVGDVEHVLKGVTPGLVASPEPESLAAALKDVLEAGRRSNGPERIRAAFSVDVSAARLRKVYEDVVERWRSGRRHGWRTLRR